MILSKTTIKVCARLQWSLLCVWAGFLWQLPKVTLSGCRATFPEPLYQRYFNDLRNEQLKSTIKALVAAAVSDN